MTSACEGVAATYAEKSTGIYAAQAVCAALRCPYCAYALAVVTLAAAMLCLAAYGFAHASTNHERLDGKSAWLDGVSGCVGLIWSTKLFLRLRATRTLGGSCSELAPAPKQVHGEVDSAEQGTVGLISESAKGKPACFSDRWWSKQPLVNTYPGKRSKRACSFCAVSFVALAVGAVSMYFLCKNILLVGNEHALPGGVPSTCNNSLAFYEAYVSHDDVAFDRSHFTCVSTIELTRC